jgi:hypothetical protein
MHRILGIILAAATLISAVSASYAMPLAPLEGNRAGLIIKVEGGCGRGFHRGPFGGCQPNRPMIVAPAAPVVVAPAAPVVVAPGAPAVVAPGPVVVAPAAPVVVATAAPIVVAPCRQVCDRFRCWRTCR